MNLTCDCKAPEPCPRPAETLGFCAARYQKLWRERSPLLAQRRIDKASAPVPACKAVSVDGVLCDRPESYRDGYCTKHHHRVRAHGDARIAQSWAVGPTTVNTVLAYEIRSAAQAGVDATVLARVHSLPVTYTTELIAGRGWHGR